MESSDIDPQLTMDDDVVLDSLTQRRIEDISHGHAQVQQYPIQASANQTSNSIHYLTPVCFYQDSSSLYHNSYGFDQGEFYPSQGLISRDQEEGVEPSAMQVDRDVQNHDFSSEPSASTDVATESNSGRAAAARQPRK